VDTVDCHFHVIAPLDRAPMASGRSYTPAPASLAQWRETLGPLGITQGVVVQPSFYGTDNQVLLGSLAEAGGALVGVAAVALDVSDTELDRLSAAGVRGVRMAHFEAGDPRAMGGFVPFHTIGTLEQRLADRAMHLQLLTDSRLLPALEERLMRFQVPVVIDHMGRAPASLGAGHEGMRSLARLMQDGPVWVKLSGVANLSGASPRYDDARAIHEALLHAAPDRLVWGSDWPHTRPSGARPSTAALRALFDQWTPLPLRSRILCTNAKSLYRLKS
jgi:predicted TIM-barrel fold metal-dependent hydrolase